MNEAPEWYETVEGPELRQGDLLSGCPLFEPPVKILTGSEQNPVEIDFKPRVFDIAVLTQSCDIEQRSVRSILVCPRYPLSRAEEILPPDIAQNAKSLHKFLEQVRRGNQPYLHLLAQSTFSENPLEIQLLDFRGVFTVALDVLSQVASDNGQRLRLNSPYREHLSQAFARFIMRVGLPVNIPKFV